MSYAIKAFQTKAGPLTLVFDFIPQEPDMPQLGKYVSHTCNNCEWAHARHSSHCKFPELLDGSHCPNWEIGPNAYSQAIVEYYKDLHRRCYG